MAEQLDGKRPLTVLAGPYGHPFHPVLVTVPIGAWVASLVFDIASHVVDRPGFLTQASEWLIGIGVLGALAAATFGLMDLLTIPRGTPAFTTGRIHAGLNLAVTVAYVVNFLWRHNDYTQGDAVSGGPLLLSVVSLLVLSASGWLGGKLSYHYGVRVADEATQAEGFTRNGSRITEPGARTAQPGRGRRP
ncbi:MAG TPA: DUF2231 domain-containing protein [Jatrophihabitans sp.]|nr:DUF2231 domain-containing protein [Jatrophihabitans sp.]